MKTPKLNRVFKIDEGPVKIAPDFSHIDPGDPGEELVPDEDGYAVPPQIGPGEEDDQVPQTRFDPTEGQPEEEPPEGHPEEPPGFDDPPDQPGFGDAPPGLPPGGPFGDRPPPPPNPGESFQDWMRRISRDL